MPNTNSFLPFFLTAWHICANRVNDAGKGWRHFLPTLICTEPATSELQGRCSTTVTTVHSQSHMKETATAPNWETISSILMTILLRFGCLLGFGSVPFTFYYKYGTASENYIEKIWEFWDSKPWLLGDKREHNLCAMPLPIKLACKIVAITYRECPRMSETCFQFTKEIKNLIIKMHCLCRQVSILPSKNPRGQ